MRLQITTTPGHFSKGRGARIAARQIPQLTTLGEHATSATNGLEGFGGALNGPPMVLLRDEA